MTDTMITVQGRFSSYYPPERATVEIGVGFEGPDRGSVFSDTVASADVIRELVKSRHLPNTGPVWSTKPWNVEGEQLPLVFHSRVGFTVKFSDFEELSRVIEEVAVIDGVTVGKISWDLTEARKTAVIAEVRSRAVKDAVAKASVYAQSIGLGSVRAVALADPGMLGDRVGTSGADGGYSSMRMMAAGSAPELSLTPEDIEVVAIVDAKFIAS